MMIVKMDVVPSQSVIAQLIRNRRTVHDFTPEVVPVELILQAIEVARWAPNHKLTEPWRFRLIGAETKAALIDMNVELIRERKGDEAAELTRARWTGFPGWAVVSYLTSDDPQRDKENYASVCCAIQNCMLFLWDANVGVKWSTNPVILDAEFYKILNIAPGDEQVVALLWYGYPANILNVERRDVSQIASFLP